MHTPVQHSRLHARVLLIGLILTIGASAEATTHLVPGDFATIQGAIDAASAGDTIRIWSGTYTGPINIDKSLVLIGSWPDTATVIEAPSDFETNTAYDYALTGFVTGRTIVHVGTATPIAVVIQGIVVDGLRRGPAISQARGYSGILAEQCALTLTGSLIRNVLPADSTGSTWEAGKRYNGRGVEIRGSGATAIIAGNTFEQINRFHIMVNATDNTGTPPAVYPTATIYQNTFTGKGIYNGGQKGVWFNHGAYGWVYENNVSGFDFSDPAIEPDRATGFVVWRGDLNPSGSTVIENNILTASTFTNNKGIYVWGRQDTVRDNQITGFRWGIELHNEVYPLVARNTITGGAVGIMLGDEAFGQNAYITIGGSPENKNTITGQLTPAQGGMAITLSFRDPLNKEELASPIPVNARYNDFGVYTSAEIAERVFDRADTTLGGAYTIDTVLFRPFMVPVPTLSLEAFLEGPFSSGTGLMLNTLKTSGVLAAHFSGATIPDEAVDSIGIQVRDALTVGGSTKVYNMPAWLLTDGTIRCFDDPSKSYVELPDSVSGNYYVVVYHRNHLAVMSSVKVACEGSTSPDVYDFTTAQGKAYGASPMRGMGSGGTAPFALYGGEATGDGQVTSSDYNVFSPKFTSGATGYELSDWNLDGQVTSSDFNIFLANFTAGRVSRVP